jgi:predicted Zn-ribbon and HTH transcriptional regulator
LVIGSAHDFSNEKTIQVFRQSRPYALAVTIAQLIAMGLCFLLCFMGYPPANPVAFWATILLGLIFGAFGFMSARESLSAFRPEAWVMKVTRDGLLIQFRALNRQGRLQDDGGVVWIDGSEIKAVGEYFDTRTSHPVKDDSSNEDTERFLEIRLKHGRSEELLREVRGEQAADRRDVWVWIVAADVIRVRFRGPNRKVQPRIRKALKVLGAFYPVLPPRDVRLKDWRKLTPLGARAYAAMMSDRGHMHEAAGVLSYKTQIDSQTAKRLVKERLHHLAGLCPKCGYDLRATPERCPECGHVSEPVSLTLR